MKGRDADWHRRERGRGRERMKEAGVRKRRGGGCSLNPTKGKASNCSQKERWTTEDRLRKAYQTEVD